VSPGPAILAKVDLFAQPKVVLNFDAFGTQSCGRLTKVVFWRDQPLSQESERERDSESLLTDRALPPAALYRVDARKGGAV
jgi:hypothetical protein